MLELRPVATEVDGCPACHWPPQEMAPSPLKQQDFFGLMMTQVVLEWDFTEAVRVNDPDSLDAEFRLLGHDSPGEYIYRFDRRLLDARFIDDLARDVLQWVIRMGQARQIQQEVS